MRAPGDATSALLRAIFAHFPDQALTVEDIRSRSWASATFTGARHELTFRVEGAGAVAAVDAFLHGLGDREFSMRGHVMADIALISDERRDGLDAVTLSMEALTVEED